MNTAPQIQPEGVPNATPRRTMAELRTVPRLPKDRLDSLDPMPSYQPFEISEFNQDYQVPDFIANIEPAIVEPLTPEVVQSRSQRIFSKARHLLNAARESVSEKLQGKRRAIAGVVVGTLAMAAMAGGYLNANHDAGPQRAFAPEAQAPQDVPQSIKDHPAEAKQFFAWVSDTKSQHSDWDDGDVANAWKSYFHIS